MSRARTDWSPTDSRDVGENDREEDVEASTGDGTEDRASCNLADCDSRSAFKAPKRERHDVGRDSTGASGGNENVADDVHDGREDVGLASSEPEALTRVRGGLRSKKRETKGTYTSQSLPIRG